MSAKWTHLWAFMLLSLLFYHFLPNGNTGGLKVPTLLQSKLAMFLNAIPPGMFPGWACKGVPAKSGAPSDPLALRSAHEHIRGPRKGCSGETHLSEWMWSSPKPIGPQYLFSTEDPLVLAHRAELREDRGGRMPWPPPTEASQKMWACKSLVRHGSGGHHQKMEKHCLRRSNK